MAVLQGEQGRLTYLALITGWVSPFLALLWLVHRLVLTFTQSRLAYPWAQVDCFNTSSRPSVSCSLAPDRSSDRLSLDLRRMCASEGNMGYRVWDETGMESLRFGD